MPFPFEVAFEQVQANLDLYVEEVFGALQSEFLQVPKGRGFVEYPVFEQGYEALKRGSDGFQDVSAERLLPVVLEKPMAFIVLRTMLGFSPPEWAYITTRRTGVVVPQGAARTLDRMIRLSPATPLPAAGGVTERRIGAMVRTASELLTGGSPNVTDKLHRLDKADTRYGLASLQPLAQLGVPYAMLLYERFLGRPFAGHRDSVSELVGDVLESAIESKLDDAKISFRKTRRAERVANFDQAPDFIVPDEFNPRIVLEAKITEDDGTARDKITRVQHLYALSMSGQTQEKPRFEVVACISGRGFGVRREDMRKLLVATRGKVFTLRNIDRLIECTGLRKFQSARSPGSQPQQ